MTETTTRTAVEVLHIGGPTLRLRYADSTWLTDPTFDEPGEYPGPVTLRKLTGPALGPDEVGPVDVVLLSHDEHADNLDHSGRAFLANVPTVLSTPGAAERIDGVRGLENWEAVTIGAARVTAAPALHGPPGCEPFTGIVTGFVLTAPDHPTVYVSGDNASVPVVARIAERVGRIDIAVLHVGAANVERFPEDVTLNARAALEVARLLDDAVIVPVHAEGWAHFSETLDDLARVFDEGGRGKQLRIPPVGRPMTV
ncbi:MBL fold metallo-hydrolase [Nocardia bovistercoris]|uniref:MBL fold metallo-hydrolase n=1 Tax=Nocardia bovistercoris TaxID=2785916 RepID=A0A931N3L1_9NOCA|nr:MBL fold metallo-hydrolase [Nocardia bovistercoris]MBH0777847.1 MBL fold metallo-hydrolase [Nocardia bovistercoris]